MARKRTPKRKHIIGTLMILGSTALLVSLLLFFDTDPEEQIVVSDDGLFAVEGNVPSSVIVTVSHDRGATAKRWTSVVGGVYVVSPDGVVLPQAMTLRRAAEGRVQNRDYTLAFFDTRRAMWIPVETRFDAVLDEFRASTTHFSHWALLQRPSVALLGEDLDPLIDAALQSQPTGANAYWVDVGYATVKGDFVLFESAVATGGCVEAATVQEDTIVTMRDVPATLVLGESELEGQLRAVVTWTVGSGCANLVHSAP